VNALAQLERAGYEFFLEGDGGIRYVFRGGEPPDDSFAHPLLVAVRENRQEVAAILAARRARPRESEPFTTLTRCHVIFPADTRLPFPAGRWRRLDDGRIEARLCYNDLLVMRTWRDEVLAGELGITN
jgi:hypothetical protein